MTTWSWRQHQAEQLVQLQGARGVCCEVPAEQGAAHRYSWLNHEWQAQRRPAVPALDWAGTKPKDALGSTERAWGVQDFFTSFVEWGSVPCLSRGMSAIPRSLGLGKDFSSADASHRRVCRARASRVHSRVNNLYRELTNKALKERLSLRPLIAPLPPR